MALYKYGDLLQQSHNEAFDTRHQAGRIAPYSGIYRCASCRQEVVSLAGHPLPLQNHHQHTTAQGRIRWQLAVTHLSAEGLV